jgi:hypothetical protein
MSNCRPDETCRPRLRADRWLLKDGSWYIATREGIDVGPYPSREDAQAAARELTELLRGVDHTHAAVAFIREFLRRRNATAA